MREFKDVVQDAAGNAQDGKKVEIRIAATGVKATLFATDNIGGSQKANPLTSAGGGAVNCFIQDGEYIVIVKPGDPDERAYPLQHFDLELMRADIDNIYDVSGNEANITIVATNIWYVITVAANIGSVNTVAAAAPYLPTIAANIAAILAFPSFGDGSAGAPSIKFTNDTDTGFYRPNTDLVGVSCGGLQSVVFGNNVDPNIFANKNYGGTGHSTTAFRATLNGGNGGLYLSGYNNEANFGHNSEFISGSNWVARHTDAARYTQSGGAHTWYGNIGLTSGSAFTPTELMRLTSGGNLTIPGDFKSKRLSPSTPVKFTISNGADGSVVTPAQTDLSFTGGSTDTETGRIRSYNAFANTGITEMLFATRDNSSFADRLMLSGTYLRPASDNVMSGGDGSRRFTVLHATTGTIATCDIRFKTFRAAPVPSAAELRAALRSVEEMGFFQWNDAIADPEKGLEGARWHFGPRAQGVWSICAEEGLCDALIEDPDTGDLLPPEGSIPPAFLCFDEWGEETAPAMEDVEIPPVLDDEGNEIEPARTEKQPTGETYVTREAGNRFGVRIDQLHSLMIAALNAERLKQEARLQLLEAA